VPQPARDFAALGPKGRLKAGTKLPPPMPVFPRHVEEGSEAAAS
jgi:methionyl-tRNA synthetase